jgi:hypothetical protein
MFAINNLAPKGMTPIALSLELAAADFAKYSEAKHTIILLSDGIETCGGDPMKAAQSLKDQGIDFKIFTIGFNVDAQAKAQLKELAESYGGSYSDVRNGVNLQEQLIEMTKKSYLIEKENIENRIRGGNFFDDAVEIKTNLAYQLDHHQKKGDIDYFKFQLNSADEVYVQVNPVEKCVKINGSQTKEYNDRICNPEAYHFKLNDTNQKEIVKLGSVNISKSRNSKTLRATESGYHYLLVGSELADMHKDYQFTLVKKSYGDANSDQDAPSIISEAMEIKPGLYENNYLSRSDTFDVYKTKVKKGEYVKIALTNVEGYRYSEIGLEILGELGEVITKTDKEIKVGESTKFKSEPFDESQDIFIRVRLEDKNRPDLQRYSLGFVVKKAE